MHKYGVLRTLLELIYVVYSFVNPSVQWVELEA